MDRFAQFSGGWGGLVTASEHSKEITVVGAAADPVLSRLYAWARHGGGSVMKRSPFTAGTTCDIPWYSLVLPLSSWTALPGSRPAPLVTRNCVWPGARSAMRTMPAPWVPARLVASNRLVPLTWAITARSVVPARVTVS